MIHFYFVYLSFKRDVLGDAMSLKWHLHDLCIIVFVNFKPLRILDVNVNRIS